ncbi:MAG TPA: hypothetical protein VNF26_06905 [Candidatus Baltobacterales bacterium]|nr:hypothetical protein [Candidatus Baltobacterales bacterium]
MAVLMIVLFVVIGLAVRAGVYGRRWNVVDSEAQDAFIDTCARTFVLVLLSLIGLMTLGMMYGNVLGAAHAGP